MEIERINQITGRVIKVAYEVLNELGEGFLERIYANAMAIALAQEGLTFSRQPQLAVSFRQRVVGDFEPDFLVEELVIVEIKATRAFTPEHTAQGLNYLKASGRQVGLVLNFGRSRLGIQRLANGRLT